MPTWDGAYHWHTDRTIKAIDALKLREAGRTEAGDFWCHKSCHQRRPRDGIELFVRNHKSTPHFWKGSKNSEIISNCIFHKIQAERKESYRYSQFYHDLRSWLATNEAQLSLDFTNFSESKSNKYSDFIINKSTKTSEQNFEIELSIIHKNRKRIDTTRDQIVIDLSNWTIDQIFDFQNHGKRKIIEEFELYMTPSDEVPTLQREVNSAQVSSLDVAETRSKFSSILEAFSYVTDNKYNEDEYMSRLIQSISQEYDVALQSAYYDINSLKIYMRFLSSISGDIWNGRKEWMTDETYQSFYDACTVKNIPNSWKLMDKIFRTAERRGGYSAVYRGKFVIKDNYSDGLIKEYNQIAKKWYGLDKLKVHKNGNASFSASIYDERGSLDWWDYGYIHRRLNPEK